MKTAYPITSVPVTIKLYANIPFDNTYTNHSMISDRFTYNGVQVLYDTQGTIPIPCEQFIEREKINSSIKYYPQWTMTDTFNFNFSNGLVGSVVMELTPEQTNANYMKVVSGSDIYYYFITGINQINVDTYTLSIELDVLMTYQDEFLDGIKDKPVFTNRKHCHRYTTDGLIPYCADLKTGEEMFAGVKPSIIKDVIKLEYSDTKINNIKDVKWLYICCDTTINDNWVENNLKTMFGYKGKKFPLVMLALPLNVNHIEIKDTNNNRLALFYQDDIQKGIKTLIGKGDVHGCKISPYPPFAEPPYNVSFNNGDLTIILDYFSPIEIGDVTVFYSTVIGNNAFYFMPDDVDYRGDSTLIKLMAFSGAWLIREQTDVEYQFKNVTSSQLGLKNTTAPMITRPRKDDPKLLFAPFRKYILSSPYSYDGWDFYPELTYSQYVVSSTESYEHHFTFYSNATAYIGDNNFFTTIDGTLNYAYKNYDYSKTGLLSAVNYVFPCGENALDVFNATQSQSFYTSKVASGITSGLTIAGGIASIAVGAGMTAGSGGGLTPMGTGLVVGGVSAIAQGTAGMATTIKSVDAKIEDLKNTPDAVNSIGSNFIIDESVAYRSNGLPYVVIYDCVDVIKERANDFFYQFGYQVGRDCYFNTELKVDLTTDGFIDNNIFGRQIFNYVQINEDITNKITTNIPLIAKQKLSSIFNNGITIWNFFLFPELWTSVGAIELYNPDRWFLKHELDNTEYTQV